MKSVALGSNLIEQPGAVVTADGRQIVKIEVLDGRILASVNLWDSTGKHVAKLSRGAWSFKADGYEVNTAPDNLVLTKDGDVIVQVSRSTPDQISLKQADIYTHRGDRLVVRRIESAQESRVAGDGPKPGDVEVWAAAGDKLLTLRRNLFRAGSTAPSPGDAGVIEIAHDDEAQDIPPTIDATGVRLVVGKLNNLTIEDSEFAP